MKAGLSTASKRLRVQARSNGALDIWGWPMAGLPLCADPVWLPPLAAERRSLLANIWLQKRSPCDNMQAAMGFADVQCINAVKEQVLS